LVERRMIEFEDGRMDDSEMWISGEKKDVEEMKSDRGLKCDKSCHSHGTVSVDNVVRRLGSSYTPVIPTSRVSLNG
jgi:hypothetical protein